MRVFEKCCAEKHIKVTATVIYCIYKVLKIRKKFMIAVLLQMKFAVVAHELLVVEHRSKNVHVQKPVGICCGVDG
jgi:hypothetical protein